MSVSSHAQVAGNIHGIPTILSDEAGKNPTKTPANSVITDISDQITQLISPSLQADRQTLLKGLQLFLDQVENQRKTLNYDYSDYYDRLMTDSKKIDKVIKTRIYNPDIIPASSFIETFFKSNHVFHGKASLHDAFLNKLFQIPSFTDLVYESLRENEYPKYDTYQYRMSFWEEELEDLPTNLQRAKESGARIIQLHLPHNEKFSEQEVFKVVRMVGETGMEGLEMDSNYLWEYLWAKGLLKVARLAWKSGIRYLSLWGNNIGKYLSAKELIKIITVAGKLGIKSLDLNCNKIWPKYCDDEILAIVEAAGNAGIKEFGLRNNSLGTPLQACGFLTLARVSGQNGLRSLDISYNYLSDFLEPDGMVDFVNTAGKFGIKNLEVSGNNFCHEMKYQQIIQFIRKIENSGLLHLNLGIPLLSDGRRIQIENEISDCKIRILL